MRTAAWETAPQTALKNCSKEVGEGQYISDSSEWSGEGNGTPLQYSCLEIPWTEEPGGVQFMGSLRVRHDCGLHSHFSLSCIGEGNGNPLQCSCLENPRDGGACWAAVYGVAQSRTRLKRLSSSSSSSEGRIHAIKHIFFQKVSASLMKLSASHEK